MSKIEFVGRESELRSIENIIDNTDDRHVIFINGDGGIGKTTLLLEIYQRYAKDPFIIPLVLDFDERAWHIAENLERRIARSIGTAKFQDYLNQLLTLHKYEQLGMNSGDLTNQKLKTREFFVECLNQVPKDKRIFLLFDTTDRIGKEEVWQRLKEIIHMSDRAIFVLAGRNGRELEKEVKPLLDENQVHRVDLEKFDLNFGEEYFNRKQKSLNLEMPEELKEIMLKLSEGRPILVDLALDWMAHHVPMEWLNELKIKNLDELTEDELEEEKKKFEIRLVQDVVNLKQPIDQLILLLSRVYPIKPEGLTQFLTLSDSDAADLLEKVRQLSFVKVMPEDLLSLHDEMRRMVDEYVWPKLDGGRERRQYDSEKAISYLTAEISKIEQEIKDLDATASTDLDSFLKKQTRYRQIWALREQLLFHEIFLDPDQGKDRFIELFDQASTERNLAVRRRFLELVNQYSDQFTQQQRYDIEIRQTTDCIYRQEYRDAVDLTQRILDRGALSLEQELSVLLMKANALVRFGHAEEAIVDFKRAKEKGEIALQETDGSNSRLDDLVMQAHNGLGWTYRITGDMQQAVIQYEALLQKLIHKNLLGKEYGRLLNNLSFIYSEQDRQQAIEYGHAALEHWEMLKDPFWIAKAHCTLGIAYYRSDNSAKSLNHFNEAFEMYREVPYREEMGEVLSWRGALYQDMGKEYLDLAEADLEESLSLASNNWDAMTLNRLGRVYMSRNDLATAERLITESLQRAKEIPDYVYWLGSIARLSFVAAERRENPQEALNRLEKEFETFLELDIQAEKNSLGMTYIGLARLYLNNNDLDKTLEYLKLGIPLVTEHGTYARTDVISRLSYFEKDFDRIDQKIIIRLGSSLAEFIQGSVFKDKRYLRILTFLNAWAKGKRQIYDR